MKICIVLGTRPEIIKMYSLIKECEKRNVDYFVVHSGQHYSYEMDKIFFKELNILPPKYNLDIGSDMHTKQIANIIIKLSEILISEKPNIVLVQGDTNTVLAGALTANKLGIKVGHVEAGLRSYDRTMPEEINRIVTDHISDFLFVPTNNSEKILLNENIPKNKIFNVGNTVVDAINEHKDIGNSKLDIKNNYFLLTSHRPSNVDAKDKLSELLDLLDHISNKFNYKIIWPIHPRSKKMIENFKLSIPKNVITIDPVGYLEFLFLQKNAKLILTDSGGIQEEACVLGIPCITLRENTERPETLEIGSNKLVGLDKNITSREINNFLKNETKWNNPFGDGTSGKKIIDILLSS